MALFDEYALDVVDKRLACAVRVVDLEGRAVNIVDGRRGVPIGIDDCVGVAEFVVGALLFAA